MLNWRRQWHPTPVLLTGNPMDGGAWWAAVHGVAKSRTRLRDFTFTFHFHALEKEMATHSSVLACRIPGTGEPVGLPSLESHRVGHDWSDLAAAAAAALLNCFFSSVCVSSFSFIFNWVLISFSLFCHNGFAWVLTLVLLGCSFLLRFVFLGEGLVQMAFLSSQGALFWSVHIVFRNTAAWLKLPLLLLLVHFVWLRLSFISVVPVLFQFWYQPQEVLLISGPCAGRVPWPSPSPADFTAGLRAWSGLEWPAPLQF